jgi:hypothetical protein
MSSSDFEIDATAASNSLNRQQWNVVTMAAAAPVGTSSSSNAGGVERSARSCNRCWTAGCSWLTSALGVSILLLVYLITGAIMFMILGSSSSQVEHSASIAPAGRHPDDRLLEKTMATVDRLWSITEDLNILYRDNWTHLARVEMRHYQDQLVGTLRQIMLEERYSFKQTWTFPMSLLYALTLITTIGNITYYKIITFNLIIFNIHKFLYYIYYIKKRIWILYAQHFISQMFDDGLFFVGYTVISSLFVGGW